MKKPSQIAVQNEERIDEHNATSDPRKPTDALTDEALDGVTGGTSDDKKIKRATVEMYVENIRFTIKEFDA